MMVVFESILRCAASFFEIWFGFILVQHLVDKNRLTIPENILKYTSIIGISLLLAANRGIIFYSNNMFLIQVILSALALVIIIRKSIICCIGIITCYYSIIALLDFCFAVAGIMFAGNRFETYVYLGNSIWKELIFIFSRLLVIVAVHLISKYIKPLHLKRYNKFLCIMDAFLIYILSIFQTFTIILMENIKEDILILSKDILWSLLIAIVLLIIALCSYIRSTVIIYQKNILHLQEMFYKEKYKEISLIWERNKQLIHDMRHHLFVLTTLSQEENVGKIKEYLMELDKSYSYPKMKKWTEHPVIDMILNQKLEYAKENGIHTQIQAQKGIKIAFSDSDICSILGNLLDNAIEACNRMSSPDKWINIILDNQGEMFFLKVSNSINELPVKRKGYWVTNKIKSDVHGLGLKSVESIVRQYDGELVYDVNDTSFKVSITLFANNNERRQKNE